MVADPLPKRRRSDGDVVAVRRQTAFFVCLRARFCPLPSLTSVGLFAAAQPNTTAYHKFPPADIPRVGGLAAARAKVVVVVGSACPAARHRREQTRAVCVGQTGGVEVYRFASVSAAAARNALIAETYVRRTFRGLEGNAAITSAWVSGAAGFVVTDKRPVAVRTATFRAVWVKAPLALGETELRVATAHRRRKWASFSARRTTAWEPLFYIGREKPAST